LLQLSVTFTLYPVSYPSTALIILRIYNDHCHIRIVQLKLDTIRIPVILSSLGPAFLLQFIINPVDTCKLKHRICQHEMIACNVTYPLPRI